MTIHKRQFYCNVIIQLYIKIFPVIVQSGIVPLLVYLGNAYRVIFYKVLSSYCFIAFPYIFFINLVTALSSFFNLNSFNYLALGVPTLGLYVNFFSKILYFYYYSLLGNFKYFLLTYYLAIFLLNAVQSFLGILFCKFFRL